MTMCACVSLSPVWLFAASETVGHQAPLSMGFPSKNYSVGCHSLLQGCFQTQGSKPHLLYLLHWFFTTELPGKQYMLLLLLSHFSRVWLSVWPHRRQPTRLPHPWDSPGKNTGVGCHFLLQCMKVKSEREVAQSCPTLCNPMDCSLPGSSIHGIFQARLLEWGAIAFSRKAVHT